MIPSPWLAADTESSISELFERQVALRPAKTAIAGTDWQPSYAELDAAAGGIARRVRERAGRTGEPVALLLRHDAPLIAALLGVLKAGEVAVALNPSDPPARLEQVRRDVGASVVLADGGNRSLALAAGFEESRLVPVPDRPPAGTVETVARAPSDLAVLIYTSGSTGRPNGVMQPHRNVLHNVLRLTNGLGIVSEDRLVLLSSLSSGQGLATAWVALLNGATLCPFPIMERGVTGLPRWLEDNDVSVMVLSASVYRNFVRTLNGTRLSGLRLLRLGSEAALRSDYEAYRRHFPPDCLFANTYSASEAGNVAQFVGGCDLELADGALPIGRPAQDLEVLLLGEDGEEVPPGEIGEIVVRSDRLSPGYWRNEELTARRFRDGAFRTGDLALRREGGLLVWAGRKDVQVKVRGSRVDLSEVEAALGRLPGVQVAVAGPRPSARGDTRLAAYVIPEPDSAAGAGELRQALRTSLPDHAVPTEFAFLDDFPVNAHGKVDRDALAALEVEAPPTEPTRPALSETEALVSDAWAHAFETESVGREENFFELGGDSLTAAVVAAGIHGSLGVEIELGAFAESPTVAAMAELVERLRSGAAAGRPELTRAPRHEPLPCSFIQERTWRHSRTPEESAAYTVSWGVEVRGSLDVAALRRTLERIVARHESLRTTFAERDGDPVQIVHPPGPVELPVESVASEAEARELFRERSLTAFDVERGPLVRFLLLRLADGYHWLLRFNHHINSDGRSWRIFYDELRLLYEADVSGKEPPLPEAEPLGYPDFAAWERRCYELEADRHRADVDWWKRNLEGAPERMPFPFSRRRPDPDAPIADGVFLFGLQPEVSQRLETLRRSVGVTFFMVRVAAFAAQLAADTGSDDVVVGTYATTRRQAGTHDMFGFFSNLAALRLRLDRDLSFSDLLGSVREAVVEMSAHSEMPYGELCDALRAEGVVPPELHSVFTAGDILPPMRFGGIEMVPLERVFGSMPWGFSMQMDQFWEAQRNLVAFDARVHDPLAVRAFVRRYAQLLAEGSAEPERPLGELLRPGGGRFSRLLRAGRRARRGAART
ncbi:MAG TPA: condensation domain-containing protein [Thermoleophilaceae bacterium]